MQVILTITFSKHRRINYFGLARDLIIFFREGNVAYRRNMYVIIILQNMYLNYLGRSYSCKLAYI